MRKIVLLFLMLCLTISAGIGQSIKKKPKSTQKEKSHFYERLWYGGNAVLSLSPKQDYSQSMVGLGFIVGYKIKPWLSIGQRIAPTYVFSKIDKMPLNYTLLDYGLVARAKICKVAFAQFGYGRRNLAFPQIENAGLNMYRQSIKERILGLGLTHVIGRKVAVEFCFLYDFVNNYEPESPFIFRFGASYNF
jgi:hypothetical protein